jgi:hypothetical protein
VHFHQKPKVYVPFGLLIKILKIDIFAYFLSTTTTMDLFSNLFSQKKTAVHNDTNIDNDIAEIEEDIED